MYFDNKLKQKRTKLNCRMWVVNSVYNIAAAQYGMVFAVGEDVPGAELNMNKFLHKLPDIFLFLLLLYYPICRNYFTGYSRVYYLSLIILYGIFSILPFTIFFLGSLFKDNFHSTPDCEFFKNKNSDYIYMAFILILLMFTLDLRPRPNNLFRFFYILPAVSISLFSISATITRAFLIYNNLLDIINNTENITEQAIECAVNKLFHIQKNSSHILSIAEHVLSLLLIFSLIIVIGIFGIKNSKITYFFAYIFMVTLIIFINLFVKNLMFSELSFFMALLKDYIYKNDDIKLQEIKKLVLIRNHPKKLLIFAICMLTISLFFIFLKSAM
jgi:hypothetical protein